MSTLIFSKFHGAGNDFILIDDRALTFNPQLVPNLTSRKFGIGADGLILLQNATSADFRMRIFNADGSEAAMCGNGLRCFMKYLLDLGFPKKEYRIATQNKILTANYIRDKIAIDMGKATHVKQLYIDGLEVHSLDTGVPHAVVFTTQSLSILGPKLQKHPAFMPESTNVNIAQIHSDHIQVGTFERGVGETLSCGTGAAAVGYIVNKLYQKTSPIRISMPGGELEIAVNGDQITLIGDAVKVFEGHLNLP